MMTNTTRALRTTLLAALTSAAALTASSAHAGGITNPGYGSQAQPRAGAFAAKADDPSAIFHNPAGLAKLKGTIIQLGINLINFSQTFQRSGTYDACTDAKCPAAGLPYTGQPYEKVENQSHGAVSLGNFAVVPLLSVSSDFGLDGPFTFAAGIFAPGAASADREYAPDYQIEADPSQPPPPGRYDILSQEVAVLFPSIAAAYSISDKIDIGARVSWGFADLRAESSLWGLRNYEEWESLDVQFEAKATDRFVPAFGFGALYRPRSDFEFGFNFRSGATINGVGTGPAASGAATLQEGIDVLQPKTSGPFVCAPGGNLAAFSTCLNLKLPMMASLGGRWIHRDADGSERGDVELDVQWENWSNASDVEILVDAVTVTLPGGLPPSVIRHGFKDVFSFRLGGAYRLPILDDALSVRGGLAYDTETAPESWTRLDQDGFARTTIGAGLAYDLDGWRFELSGGAILEGTRTVDHGGCNPDINNLGCELNNEETRFYDRIAPDPAQPISSAEDNTIAQSPFNAGVYEQGYVFMGMGVTASF